MSKYITRLSLCILSVLSVSVVRVSPDKILHRGTEFITQPGRNQTLQLRRSRMFIDKELHPKTRAPEERNVVSEDADDRRVEFTLKTTSPDGVKG